MARIIPLTKGYEAIVDDDDYEWLNQWKWQADEYSKNKNVVYASRCTSRRLGKNKLKMHRVIIDAPNNMDVDHINHNGLDNRRCNLRLCSTQENMRNQKPTRGGSSQYKGVSWHKQTGKWNSYIKLDKTRKSLGLYSNEIEAAIAYNESAIKHFGEFAYLNHIESLCDAAT